MAKRVVDRPGSGERRLRMGYQQFLDWADEDVHAEWVDGEVTLFMPPSVLHQRLLGFLYTLLSWYARRLDLGEVLMAPVEMRIRDGRSAREPDLLFVAAANAARIDSIRVDGPADLVVEIVSETSVGRDRVEKRREYERAGVAEYWVLDPRPRRQRAEFLQIGDDGRFVEVLLDAQGRYRSLVLPGFWLDPGWLWRDPLPDPDELKPTIAPAV